MLHCAPVTLCRHLYVLHSTLARAERVRLSSLDLLDQPSDRRLIHLPPLPKLACATVLDRPSVPGALHGDELRLDPEPLQLGKVPVRELDRYNRVGIAVYEPDWWMRRRDEGVRVVAGRAAACDEANRVAAIPLGGVKEAVSLLSYSSPHNHSVSPRP